MPQDTERDDAALVAQAAGGSELAFRTLYHVGGDSNQPALYGSASRPNDPRFLAASVEITNSTCGFNAEAIPDAEFENEAFRSGFDLDGSWEDVSRLDDSLGERISYAFNDQLGLLSRVCACLADDARQSLHMLLERNHARAHESVLDLGDRAPLLHQLVLRLARQRFEQ